MPDLVVYEKPTCSTCVKLRQLLDDRGIAYERVDYHRRGLTEEQVRELVRKAGVPIRDLLRTREPLHAELALDDERRWTDEQIVGLVVEHPALLQRPVVVSGDRAVLARPVERALDLVEAGGAANGG
jgi:arsenate reductase